MAVGSSENTRTYVPIYTASQHSWPASKEDLITKYKKQFFALIESIDFDDLNV